MNKKNKPDLRILSLKIKLLYLLILFSCLVATVISFYYESETGLELSLGTLSGASISFVASFASAEKRKHSGDEEQMDCNHLLSLLKETIVCKGELQSGLSVYADSKDDDLDISRLINNAKNRIWILGSDLSNFVIKHGKSLGEVCSKNHSIQVRILSLHPQNLFCSMRYNEVGWKNANAMSSSVKDACFSLKEIEKVVKDSNPNFRLNFRLYFSQPTVRLYLIDDTMIISHFINGVRSSDSVHILCNTNKHPEIAHDFLDAHFEDVWKDAVDIKVGELTDDTDPTYAIGKNGQIIEYLLKGKKCFLTKYIRQFKRLIEKEYSLITYHLLNLITPLIFVALAGTILLAIKNDFVFTQDKYTTLTNYLTNMSLGFISGSVLSCLEYVIQVRHERCTRNYKQEQQTIATSQLYDNFNKILGANFREYGVSYCLNRNEANIKQRILSAKKRVWIYATNNKYINSLKINDFLRSRNDLDIRFLMLSPKSLFISTRFSEIPGKDCAYDFSKEISDNLQQMLFENKKESPSQIRLFFDHPTFMMYLIDDVLIISHILRQGRARDQVHFIFDLRFPDVKNDTYDFIKHFMKIWDRSERCNKKNINAFNEKKYVTIIDENFYDAIPQNNSQGENSLFKC